MLNKNKNNRLALLSALLVLLAGYHVSAAVTNEQQPQQDKSVTVDKHQPTKITSGQATSQTQSTAPTTQTKNDVFRPTEQISEDLAVSFPTDI